ncbi:MAG: carboxylesterase family protein [Collimonas sp.]|uniref:carboxylesterase/lipase family protein n=1 Tax=Collimonas sp. TaxID=1963772 RepID=UPI0032641B99
MHSIHSSFIVAALFAAALTGCSGGDSIANLPGANGTVAQTDSGAVQGATQDGILVFKGIPYAAPPVGPLRWQPPQAPAAWSAIRPAQSFGHDCMQLPLSSDAAPSSGLVPDEDCLVLNLWRPADTTQKKLPVVVWIYGGGGVNGSSASAVYDGTQFAKQGVILVSFNYRLGRFGFFGHPALTKENPTGLLGNYGFMDQLAALHWVQRNIGAFGGDANNVTVFGQSAGGFAVHVLMTSPLSKGMFNRAIAQSGGGRAQFVPGRRLHETGPNGLPSGEQVGVTFAGSVGISGEDATALAALRALPANTIVSGLNMATLGANFNTFSNTMIDGQLIVDEPGKIYAAGKAWPVPLIVGATNADLGFPSATTMDQALASFAPANRAAALAAYDPQGTGNVAAVAIRIASDQLMVEPARFVAQTLSAQAMPVYEYRFSYVATSIRNQVSGAPHASELPYVFNTLNASYGAAATSQDQQMAQLMNNYWVAFAKTGSPNGSGLPQWSRYDVKSDALLDMSAAGATRTAIQPDPWKTRLDLIQQLN